MASRKIKSDECASRDPDRTRRRILAAALREFAAKGFAGARVDRIAIRSGANKRMLYHYFGDKEGLFRAVLHQKISERQAWAATLSSDAAERLPFWFKNACEDADWVRLLEWEALQGSGAKFINQKERRLWMLDWLKRLRQRQADGELTSEFDACHLALAMQSLTMFPVAFPQLTRLITDKSISDVGFQRAYADFIKKFAAAFRPKQKAK
jgi:AcrR family transcriptional regulator